MLPSLPGTGSQQPQTQQFTVQNTGQQMYVQNVMPQQQMLSPVAAPYQQSAEAPTAVEPGTGWDPQTSKWTSYVDPTTKKTF